VWSSPARDEREQERAQLEKFSLKNRERRNLGGVASFSFGGEVFSGVTLAGTFTVNADGSVSATTKNSLGEVLHLILYPTPDGNAIAFVQTDPGSITNGVLTRGTPTRDEQ